MRIFILALVALVLTACGGSSDSSSSDSSSSDSSSSDSSTVNIFKLSFSATKSFDFSWPEASDATYYKLLENSDGNSGFTQVGSNLSRGTLTYSHIVTLYERMSAQYVLQNCNDSGCSDSRTLSVSDTLTGSIGYVKASNTDAGDAFGNSLALSSDGKTLAVSAPNEDSNATGIDGEQDNNTASESGAIYIFTLNSSNVWSQQAYIKASNAESEDQFGKFPIALSSDGDTLAVSAASEDSASLWVDGNPPDNNAINSGAVYIFTRDNNDSWSQEAYLKGIETEAGDYFGESLALSSDGNTLAVGAPNEDSNAMGVNGSQYDNSVSSSGAAYVFTRSDSYWSQKAYLKASNAEKNDNFGSHLDMSADGKTIAVGAKYEDSSLGFNNANPNDNEAINSGAVYVFVQNDITKSWSQQVYLKADTPEFRDLFGTAISLSEDGNTLAVGAYYEDSSATGIDGNQADNNADASGAVYIFSRDNTIWSQQAYLKASNTGNYDLFGFSLSLSPDSNTLAVGAYHESSNSTGIGSTQSDNTNVNSGAVYVFKRDNSTWSQQAYLKASNTGGSDYFGFNLDLTNDGGLAIGAKGEDSARTGINSEQTNNVSSSAGAVYLY